MSNRDLHYVYGISYLVCVIVALIAFALFDVPNLVDKVSFALTVASLVLAVVAIVYTFVAAAKQEGQLAKLLEANNAMSIAAVDVRTAAASLLGQVTNIPPSLDLISKRIDALKLTERPVESVPSVYSDVQVSDAQFKAFVAELPFGAMSVLYAFFIASQHDKALTESSMSNWSPLTFNFVFGFLSGVQAIGLIDFKFHNGEIVPVKCSPVVANNLKRTLESIFDHVSAEQADSLRDRMKRAQQEFS